MPRTRIWIQPVAALLLMGPAAACTTTADLITAAPPRAGALFTTYVALGNSITAGFQSGGINDSTQRESYAALLAGAMGTRFALPLLAMPGCPPPVDNALTQHRVGGGTDASCALREPSSAMAVINDVAVPGATSRDLIAPAAPSANLLTQLILGGETQVQRALEADPTFVSVWIGNNDVLDAATSGVLTATPGISPGFTPPDTFAARYETMMAALRRAPHLKGGVLIGVVDVARIPLLFPATALLDNAAFKAAFDQAAGTTVRVLDNCAGSTSRISLAIIAQIHSGAQPATIGCEKNSVPGTAVGDVFVLDADEQATIHAIVAAYNAEISRQAADAGFAYLDPNAVLDTLEQSGAIPAIPDPGSATHPFGRYISLDGIHPARPAHALVANLLIDVINAKCGTAIPHVAPWSARDAWGRNGARWSCSPSPVGLALHPMRE
ncbi:MAG TPA: SGNH/GDSL hydrolase family protein [Gemmatimonadaceae bacterium]|nr:SGNH/GDSL hydrolase family protein [Gemmatimonadaceae bacterium]